MKQCTRCEEYKPLELFYKNKRRKDGYNTQCKICADSATKKSRSKKLDHYQSLRNASHSAIRERFYNWKAERCCIKCGENSPCCLDLHHIDPSTKEANASALAGYSWDRLMKEVEKCIVVCKNCHAKIHAGLLTI